MSSSSKKAARRGRRGRRRRSGDDAQNPCRLAFAVALLRLRGARCCVARDAGVNCMEGTAGRGAARRPYRPYSRQARRGATHPDGRQRGPAQRGARARERPSVCPHSSAFGARRSQLAASSAQRRSAAADEFFSPPSTGFIIYIFLARSCRGKKKKRPCFWRVFTPNSTQQCMRALAGSYADGCTACCSAAAAELECSK